MKISTSNTKLPTIPYKIIQYEYYKLKELVRGFRFEAFPKRDSSSN